jgi:ribosomal 50S subunit-associated protein YjgA (DUF615 family)
LVDGSSFSLNHHTKTEQAKNTPPPSVVSITTDLRTLACSADNTVHHI